MTEENKFRLRQLGWGEKAKRPETLASVRRRNMQDIRILKLEKELKYVRDWLQQLGNRYRERGYDSDPIDRMVVRIKEALK